MFCSTKETEESLKLKTQDEVKRFYLFSFHVYHLRDLLKCTICLELYTNPVELTNCKHVFCKNCIDSYLEYAETSETYCPVCQKCIGDSSLEQHGFFDKISVFVSQALQDVNAILGSNLNKLPSYSKIFQLWEQNKDSTKIFAKMRTTTLISSLIPDYSAILKAKKVVVGANAKYVKSSEDQADAFDAVVDLPTQNRFFKSKTPKSSKKKYTMQQKEQTPAKNKVHKFENDTNKHEILNWLHDTRNKFDIIPLTQQQVNEELPDFDLPSVSQKINSQKRSKVSDTNGTHRKQYFEVKSKTHERRTRSLEYDTKSVISKANLKRHSISTCNVGDKIVVVQANIEEDRLNPKKTALVNLIEDECVDAIDKEVLSTSKQPNIVTSRRSNRLSATRAKHGSTVSNSRGWGHIKQFKKTIGNTKKTRKLKVTHNSSILPKDDHDKNCNRKNSVLATAIIETDEGCNTNSFDFNEVESNSKNHLNTSINPKSNDEHEKNLVDNEGPDVENRLHNSVAKEKDVHSASSKRDSPQPKILDASSNSVISNCSMELTNNELQVENAQKQKDPVEDVVFKNMLLIHGMENSQRSQIHQDFKEKNSNKENQHKLKHDLNYDDDYIFTLNTQANAVESRNPIQEQLHLLRCIMNKDEDPSTILNEIREMFIEDANPITEKVLRTVDVQTDAFQGAGIVSTASSQTMFSHYKEVGIQTDTYDDSNGFRISSTDMFQIQPVISSSVQTDCVLCRNCKCPVFEDVQIVSPIAFKSIKKPIQLSLSGSFDNLNFETQDVIRGQEISVKNVASCHKINQFIKTPGILISQDKNENKIETSSHVTSETIKERENLKRTRTNSDNDSDTSQFSACKKNKHLSDLSIEFLSEQVGDGNCIIRTNTDIPNCPEILDNGPKSDDKNESPNNLRVEPAPKRLKTQDIINECEQIIKEACSTTLRIEHTENIHESKPSSLLEEFNEDFLISVIEVENKAAENNVAKKFSESLFTAASTSRHSQKEADQTLRNQSLSKEKVDDFINKFKEIEDSFEEDCNAEIESITDLMVEDNKADRNKINIVSNVSLKGVNKEFDQNFNANRSAEMFDSDSEVIDTTPQKNRPIKDGISILSQLPPKARMKLPLESEVLEDAVLSNPLSCFNKTFTPPPEFQDFLDDNRDKEQEKENEHLSSLTADLLKTPFHEMHSKIMNDSFITSTPFASNSQILSTKVLNLSPIHSSSKQMNPILAVQSASKLPLVITRSKTPPHQKITPLNTSTPKQKSILNYVKTGDSLSLCEDKTIFSQLSQLSFVQKKPTVACTRMNKNELSTIVALANKKIVAFTSTFSVTVTHMIVAVDKRNRLLDHTMKFVSAVAAGIWIVNIKWIEECLKQNKVVPEEAYEALDVSGADGPRRSRLNRSQNPLLRNFVVHVAPPFMSTTQKEVENVIILLGGEVVSRPDDFLKQNEKICLIIAESTGSQIDDVYETWLDTLKVVTVDLEWLSRSVGKFETQSLRPFALCCEESIVELPYPPSLLEDVPSSFAHSTLT